MYRFKKEMSNEFFKAMSRTEIAELLEISKTCMSYISTGKRNCKKPMAIAICTVTGNNDLDKYFEKVK